MEQTTFIHLLSASTLIYNEILFDLTSLYSLRVYREIAWPVSRLGYTSSRPVSFLFYHTNLNIPFNSHIDIKYPSHLMDWNIWFSLSIWYETDNEYITNRFHNEIIIDIVYCYSAHQHVHRTIQADPIVTGVRNKCKTILSFPSQVLAQCFNCFHLH